MKVMYRRILCGESAYKTLNIVGIAEVSIISPQNIAEMRSEATSQSLAVEGSSSSPGPAIFRTNRSFLKMSEIAAITMKSKIITVNNHAIISRQL